MRDALPGVLSRTAAQPAAELRGIHLKNKLRILRGGKVRDICYFGAFLFLLDTFGFSREGFCIFCLFPAQSVKVNGM